VQASDQCTILQLPLDEVFFKDRAYSREGEARPAPGAHLLGKIASQSGSQCIYGYLSAVFELVMWWRVKIAAISPRTRAAADAGLDLPTIDEPFAAVILCAAAREKVDKANTIQVSRVSDMRRSTDGRRTPPHSSGGRVASTNARRDLLDARATLVMDQNVEVEISISLSLEAQCGLQKHGDRSPQTARCGGATNIPTASLPAGRF